MKAVRRTAAQIQKQDAQYAQMALELVEMEEKKRRLAAEMDLMLEASKRKHQVSIIRHVSQLGIPATKNENTQDVLDKNLLDNGDILMNDAGIPQDTPNPLSDIDDTIADNAGSGSEDVDSDTSSNPQRKVCGVAVCDRAY